MNGKKKTFTPGFILTLHTFGRDLKWNPHIHCLITEGGMDEDSHYKVINYINYETLRKSFMASLAKRMREFYADSPIEKVRFTSLHVSYQKYKIVTNFFKFVIFYHLNDDPVCILPVQYL